MNAFERLRHIMGDERTVEIVNGAFFSIRAYGTQPWQALTQMADRLCGLHGLSAEVHQNAVVFYLLGSRAKQPACIVVSLAGNTASPSAMAERHTPHALIQLFEGDADDTDMAGSSAHHARWVETKGRLLFY
jgi:hypothetical protein